MRHTVPTNIARLIAVLIISACAAATGQAAPAESQVLFVCEHGNVKSLMAASYFNRLASQRGLPYHAISRGTAPNSTTVPPPIAEGLKSEGFDVTAFHPAAVAEADVVASSRVVVINTVLPESIKQAGPASEQWTDVPAASVDYAAASAALKKHVEALIDDLSHAKPQ
jgi:arsenate reductase